MRSNRGKGRHSLCACDRSLRTVVNSGGPCRDVQRPTRMWQRPIKRTDRYHAGKGSDIYLCLEPVKVWSTRTLAWWQQHSQQGWRAIALSFFLWTIPHADDPARAIVTLCIKSQFKAATITSRTENPHTAIDSK